MRHPRSTTVTAAGPATRRRKYSLVRIGIVVLIALVAVGAFALQLGILRFVFRGVLIIGAIALFGSYFWGLWLKWSRRAGQR